MTLFSFWGFCFGSTVKVLDHLQFFGWHIREKIHLLAWDYNLQSNCFSSLAHCCRSAIPLKGSCL